MSMPNRASRALSSTVAGTLSALRSAKRSGVRKPVRSTRPVQNRDHVWYRGLYGCMTRFCRTTSSSRSRASSIDSWLLKFKPPRRLPPASSPRTCSTPFQVLSSALSAGRSASLKLTRVFPARPGALPASPPPPSCCCCSCAPAGLWLRSPVRSEGSWQLDRTSAESSDHSDEGCSECCERRAGSQLDLRTFSSRRPASVRLLAIWSAE
mmetsp:Transcript_24509/g.83802  ORF Transcript_24509/g.83802 Transcript_24509/m.83802 type:complete len:209 (-) Transcript_24509:197-823(-)